jgi:uncharacterized RDD family membrane protein YckC
VVEPTLRELGLSEDLVTGEAVVLELRAASFATRAMALALDLVVLFGAALVLWFATSMLFGELDPAAGAAVGLAVAVGILVGIPVTVETLTRGRSLGKIAAGLRVVRDDGGPIRFRHALVRGLLGVVEFYATGGSLAIISSLADRRGKRLGDFLAGTYVVRERVSEPVQSPVVMPPELAPWVSGTDLGRIQDQLAIAARAFLNRAATLHPASRQRLGVALADELALHVAPPPPSGTLPERFIAAVLAERCRRDLSRLQAEAGTRAARAERRRNAPVLSATSTRLVGEDH